MKEPKFTKGLWRAHGKDFVSCPNGEIATVSPYRDNPLANAQLIAAAPELFEALKMFSEEWDNFLSKTNMASSNYSAREVGFLNLIGFR